MPKICVLRRGRSRSPFVLDYFDSCGCFRSVSGQQKSWLIFVFFLLVTKECSFADIADREILRFVILSSIAK